MCVRWLLLHPSSLSLSLSASLASFASPSDAFPRMRSPGCFGRALFMRDELREVAPGVILGLGSMGATGGMWNCTPFVLTPARDR